MRRSERLRCKARCAGLMAASIMAVSMAAAAWTVFLWFQSAGLGALCALASILGVRLALWHLGEFARLRRMSQVEQQWETERAIRPRI